MNTRLTPVFTLLTVAALATSASCFAAEKFTFLTNWYAQAEHGGFYQAQATGLYQHAGLDVEIKMGGPQINVMQLMAAGQADCTLGDNGQALETWQAGVHAVTVATVFQHSPTVFITHDNIGIITEPRLKKTWDMLVKNKLIDASKVPFEQTYTLEMVKDAGVMP